MPRHWRFRIADVLEAIADIERFTSGMDLHTFEKDRLVSLATQRSLEIIGEAVTRLPDHIASRYPEAPWQDIRGLRNVLAHQYFGVGAPIL